MTPGAIQPQTSISVIVSVIICTYNRKHDLWQCLESIRIIPTPDLEIIIVDNHSTDGTAEALRRDYPAVNLIRNPVNRGTAYARNQGIKRARGEYVWFLDSDTLILSPDTLANMLNYFRTHPHTGSLGGQIIKEGHELIYWIMSKTDHKIPVSNPGVHEYTALFMATCNMLVRRDVLIQLGGFDLYYFYYCEDLDIGLRITNLGLNNVFRSDCCVLHKFSQKERAGEYYLFYRNVLRAFIINRTAWYIISYPFTQTVSIVHSFISFWKQGKKMENIKTFNETKKLKYAGQFGVVKLGAAIYWSLVKACFWNTARLPRTIFLRYRRPNYLAQVHEFN